ncbi:MAG: endopeptidase La [Phycisphaeraceae bacterium]
MNDDRREKRPAATGSASPGGRLSPMTGDVGPAATDRGGLPDVPGELPVLPIRSTVIFPATITPLVIARPSSKRLLDESLPQSKVVAFFSQRDADQASPGPEDLHETGTAGMVLKLIRQSDETVSLIVHGLRRIRLGEVTEHEPFLRAAVQPLDEKPGRGREFEASVEQLRDEARRLIEASPGAPEQAVTVLMNIDEPGQLADFVAANLNLDLQDKQDLLAELDVARRVRAVHREVTRQLDLVQLQQKIQEDVQSSIGKTQRKIYLREQLRAIQRELGQEAGATEFIQRIRAELDEAGAPENVRAEAERELARLEAIPPASPEYSVITSHLELIAELPWQRASEDNLDLDRARAILDRDHHALEKVKKRLIEYLAVRKLNPEGRGAILCLVGPPGVGKTSLGQSIADALGRKFARLSLGGIRDEAEIRGHRRTYVGAMPGRIIQEIRRTGTNNPVLMLDEIDKLGSDFRGDPASALLEVLDPRQNHAFVDRYLDVPFDLSRVIFIATANYMGPVPPALRDRMEVITIPGYTEHDKLEIARRYLVPRQLRENGLRRKDCKWRAAGLRKLIHDYTREAGVRNLERQIGAVCRGVAAEIAAERGEPEPRIVDAERIRDALGAEPYMRELDTRTESPGVAVGLAYTPVGGEILFIEATAYPGRGNITLTGQMGGVMRESASAALSLFKSRAPQFHFDVQQLQKLDLHIHVPAGAVPKDGPSAGVAIYVALASLLLDVPVRHRVGLTGEVTLRGKVLPVGGIKEKTLAASRAGVKTIILPGPNEKDLEEVDERVKKGTRFAFIDTVDEVLDLTLGKTRLEQAIRRLEKQARERREQAAPGAGGSAVGPAGGGGG